MPWSVEGLVAREFGFGGMLTLSSLIAWLLAAMCICRISKLLVGIYGGMFMVEGLGAGFG